MIGTQDKFPPVNEAHKMLEILGIVCKYCFIIGQRKIATFGLFIIGFQRIVTVENFIYIISNN